MPASLGLRRLDRVPERTADRGWSRTAASGSAAAASWAPGRREAAPPAGSLLVAAELRRAGAPRCDGHRRCGCGVIVRPGLRCLGLRGRCLRRGRLGGLRWRAGGCGRGRAVVVVVTRVDGVGSSRPLVSRTTTAAIAASTTATPAASNANGWRYQGDGAAWSDVGSSGSTKVEVRTGAVVVEVDGWGHVGDVLGLRPRQRGGRSRTSVARALQPRQRPPAAARRPTWHLPRPCPGRPCSPAPIAAASSGCAPVTTGTRRCSDSVVVTTGSALHRRPTPRQPGPRVEFRCVATPPEVRR